MKELKLMEEQLISVVCAQLSDIKSANAEELGAAIDMIKDLAEASYYCTVTKAMEEGVEYKEDHDRRYYPRHPKDRDTWGRETHYPDHEREEFREWEYPRDITRRDPKEGRSPVSRKMYMESKELHKDSSRKMQELETYLQELTSDLIEMIEDATPEEKQLLKTKIATLSTKIG